MRCIGFIPGFRKANTMTQNPRALRTAHTIAKAADYAHRAARAENTGQPSLARLYRQAAGREIAEALQQIRRSRINHNPMRAFHYLAQDMEQAAKAAFGPFVAAVKALQRQQDSAANTKSYYRKGDYALAGPSKGVTP